MKKVFTPGKSITTFIAATALLAAPIALFAQQFVPLVEDLPGVQPGFGFFDSIYKFGVGIAAALAVIVIMIGGIKYMSTDSIGGKSEGKKRIGDALIGLLLVLTPFVIFGIINPNILTFNLNLTPVEYNVPTSGTGGSQPDIKPGVWTYIPSSSDIGGAKYCRDVLGTGWVNVDPSKCQGSSPGPQFDCCEAQN